ncbi:MAG: hypothetical protein FJW20_16935 [Acidimicrobiia bacterium]|nr:hypothetical protein [Acidimicrobiia bacterium]
MILKRSVRIVKKVRVDGLWKFVSLERNGKRYVWDERPGGYFLDWRESGRRRREFAGLTPAQALQAQKRKQAEIAGALVLDGNGNKSASNQPAASSPEQNPNDVRTPIADAVNLFLAHVAAHSPDKPETVRRYRQVLEHFQRHLGHKKVVEAISRADIDEYKIQRRQEKSARHDRLITAPTVNFEVGTLRTFFYYLINERGLKIVTRALAARNFAMPSRKPVADHRRTLKPNSMQSSPAATPSRRPFSRLYY